MSEKIKASWDIEKLFYIKGNDDLRRWEFTPKPTVEYTSYTVSYDEAWNLDAACNAVLKSITGTISPK